MDTYFIRYDWGASNTTYVLALLDQVGGETYVVPLGGDTFDLTQAATFWPQIFTENYSNPLPGTGFAIGEGIALSELPNVTATQNDRIIGTDGDDTILGGIGDDTLKGRPGNDVLDGQDDADLIDGGGGGDNIALGGAPVMTSC